MAINTAPAGFIGVKTSVISLKQYSKRYKQFSSQTEYSTEFTQQVAKFLTNFNLTIATWQLKPDYW
jgi:hypothetical protein